MRAGDDCDIEPMSTQRLDELTHTPGIGMPVWDECPVPVCDASFETAIESHFHTGTVVADPLVRGRCKEAFRNRRPWSAYRRAEVGPGTQPSNPSDGITSA